MANAGVCRQAGKSDISGKKDGFGMFKLKKAETAKFRLALD